MAFLQTISQSVDLRWKSNYWCSGKQLPSHAYIYLACFLLLLLLSEISTLASHQSRTSDSCNDYICSLLSVFQKVQLLKPSHSHFPHLNFDYNNLSKGILSIWAYWAVHNHDQIIQNANHQSRFFLLKQSKVKSFNLTSKTHSFMCM